MSALDMDGMKRHPRADFVLRVFLAIAIGWLGFVLVARELGGQWPTTIDQQSLLILAGVAATLITFKTFQLVSGTRHWTRLGASMIAMNAAFSYGYIFAVIFRVWPSIQDNPWLRGIVYVAIVLTGMFAFEELIQVPGKNDRARPKLTIAMAGIAAILGGVLWFTT